MHAQTHARARNRRQACSPTHFPGTDVSTHYISSRCYHTRYTLRVFRVPVTPFIKLLKGNPTLTAPPHGGGALATSSEQETQSKKQEMFLDGGVLGLHARKVIRFVGNRLWSMCALQGRTYLLLNSGKMLDESCTRGYKQGPTSHNPNMLLCSQLPQCADCLFTLIGELGCMGHMGLGAPLGTQSKLYRQVR